MPNDSDDQPEPRTENLPPVERSSAQIGDGQEAPKLEISGASFIEAFSSTAKFMGPVPNPLVEKITPEHIDKIIDYSERNSVRSDNADNSQRKYQFGSWLLGAGAIIGLIIFFTLKGYSDHTNTLLGVVAGFLGGLGFGRFISK